MKLNKLTPQSYTLKSDKEVTVQLRPLSAAERLNILGVIETSKNYGSALLEVCKLSLISWEGITDGKKKLACVQENIELLPEAALIELGTHVLGLSQLTEDEKKV